MINLAQCFFTESRKLGDEWGNLGDMREKKEFNEFIHPIGSEIEQAQVKLVSAANSQMLLHY